MLIRLIISLALLVSSLAGFETVYLGGHHCFTQVDFPSNGHPKGFLTGFSAGYERRSTLWFSDIDFEGFWSLAPVSSRPCCVADVTEYLVDGKMGLCLLICDFMFKPYVGVGYNRFTFDQKGQISPATYRYTKYYAPLGVYMSYPLFGPVTLGFLFEWRADLYSRLKAFSDTFKLEKLYGYRVEVPFVIDVDTCSSALDVRIIPFYDKNRFGSARFRNDAGELLAVPGLQRFSAGLKVAVGLNY